MSVSTVIYTLLSASSTITGVVGTRIYPQQVPQVAGYPAITFTSISNVPTNTKGSDGKSTMDRYRIQVTMVATLQSTIDTLGDAVRTALDYTYMQTIAGTKVQLISYQNEVDMFDEGSAQDGVFIKHQDYILTISK